MSTLWADHDELRTFRQFKGRGLSNATTALRMGRSVEWVEQMVIANRDIPRLERQKRTPVASAPDPVPNDCAKHLRLVWQSSGGMMFPYCVERRRAA